MPSLPTVHQNPTEKKNPNKIKKKKKNQQTH